MKLTKFKLIAGGLGGISITCTEYIMGTNNVMFSDDVTRTRKVPFPYKFKQSVARLKYYFLVLTGHWIEPFNKYYNRSTHTIARLPETGTTPMGQTILLEIMNKINITGVVFTGKGFLFTGTIDSYGDKTIGISTRLVTEEDDAGFYQEALGVINSVFSDVGIFFKEGKVIEDSPKTYLEDMGYSEKEDLGDLSEEEMTERVLDAFQKRGGIVLMPADGSSISIDNASSKDIKVSLDDKTGNVVLDTRTGSIDGKHLEEVSSPQIDPEREEVLKATADHIVDEVNKSKAKDADNNSEKPADKESKSVDSDREFPKESISDDDIKAAVGPVTEAAQEEVIPPVKTKKKSSGSTLASEKDFAAATGEQVREDQRVDLTGAEFSEGNPNMSEGNHNPEVDDWSQEPENDSREGINISQEDLDGATQG